MKKNIIGILHHMINKKDLAQQHLYCPRGPESWCAWQRDVEDGTKTYRNINCLPNVFFDLLKLIFLDLSDEKLLARCIQRATQNPNESINSLVWARCPKHKSMELDQYSLLLLQLYLHLMEVQKGKFNSKTA